MKYKLKISQANFLRLIPYITISIILGALSYTMWFLYQDVLLGIYDTADLESKSQNVIQIKLNTQTYDEVSQLFEVKGDEAIGFEMIENPFAEEERTIIIEPLIKPLEE